jgi:hypothetical protein
MRTNVQHTTHETINQFDVYVWLCTSYLRGEVLKLYKAMHYFKFVYFYYVWFVIISIIIIMSGLHQYSYAQWLLKANLS